MLLDGPEEPQPLHGPLLELLQAGGGEEEEEKEEKEEEAEG